VPKQWHDVVVSTYGRGIFILRDIAPLELAGALPDSAVTLFPPHPGYRQSRSGHADITFNLQTVSPRPARVEILDSTNKVVRTLQVPTRVGLNRTAWDLRYDAPHVVALRTPAPDNPHIFDEPRFKNRTTRPITHWGIQGAQTAGPIALAGTYTVRLNVNGRTQTQTLTILKDPEVKTPDADLAASTHAQVRVRDDMNAAADLVNKIEVMRKQILDQQKANGGKPDVLASLADLDRKMLAVELQLLSRTDMNSDDKFFVEPYKVYMNLIWLNGVVGNGAGDVAGGADYAPTESALKWLGTIEKDLDSAKSSYKKLMEADVAGFNAAMEGKLPPIADAPPRIIP
jgi:hypothetical protein